MNKILVIILALLLTACAVQPPTEAQRSTHTYSSDTMRIYDADGNFAGHIDEGSRRIYDRDGNFVGMIQ